MSCPNGYEKTSNGCLPNCKPGYSSDGINKCYRFCVDEPISDNYCTVVPCPNGGIFNPVYINDFTYNGTCSGPGISTYPAKTKGLGGGIPDIYTRDVSTGVPLIGNVIAPVSKSVSKSVSKRSSKKKANFTNTNINYSYEYYIIFICLLINIFLYYYYLKKFF